MVTSNSSKAPSSPGMSSTAGLDSPPSYDYVASLPPDDQYGYTGAAPQAVGSSSTAVAPSGTGESRGPPRHIEHLFAGPPNAERLLARNSTPLERVAGIATHKKWGYDVTFDPALQNPDTLYDFLRYHTLEVPAVKLKIQGAHLEHHQRDEWVDDGNGGKRHQRKGQTERVVDFDFWIDLQKVLDHSENTANIHLRGVGPEDPVHRGTFVNHYAASYRPPETTQYPGLQAGGQQGYAALLPSGEYSSTDIGARAGRRDPGYTQEERNRWFFDKGMPLWTDVTKVPEFWADRAASKKGKRSAGIALPESVASSPATPRHGNGRGEDEEADIAVAVHSSSVTEQSLRAWCLKYCQDPGMLKSFRMSKWYWGWETAALEMAVRGAILSTGYQSNDVKVEWDVGKYSLTVRPPNFLSKVVWDVSETIGRSSRETPVYLMPLIVLLYPLIWLWQRCYSAGGAPYSIARASYAFKFYPPLPSTFPNETVEAARDRLPSLYKLHPELPKTPVLQPGPKGIHYLLGRKEGEWFREWEERIRMGVRMRYKGELQDTRVGEHEPPMLDGY